MSVNVSSPTNTTFNLYHCFDIKVNVLISLIYAITKLFLLLPLSIFILALGCQQWRRQRSFQTTSHSDFFTYQMAAMEVISEVGWCLHSCGFYMDLPAMTMVGFYGFFIVFPGQIAFHILTCVERYLAVVHPITYLGLKQSGGVRIRNLSTGCVWLLCFGWMGVTALYGAEFPIIPFFSLLIFSLIAVSFCSFSVLRVLIRPGPGEVGKGRERVDQSKKRAFHTVMAITGVLGLWFVGILICFALEVSQLLNKVDGCLVLTSAIWFNLPGSFVLPLLFLHRLGKLPYCSSNAQ